MRPTNSTTSKLMRIVEPVCTGAGYELVDLALTQSRGGWVLQVFIDRAPIETGSGEMITSMRVGDEAGVGIDDCERVSRELSAVLDVEDPIGHAYQLEVSSPGLDRPLRTLAHFRRFLGHEVKLRLVHGVDGRRNFKGTLSAVESAGGPNSDSAGEDGGAVLTVLVDGQEYRLPFHDIESARVVPDWDEIMSRQARRDPSGGPGRLGRS